MKRARHVVEEIERSNRAEALLETNDIQSFGRLVNECHTSLRDLYEVSCPKLNTLVDIAQVMEGCIGARLTGAGFGGCTVNLVENEKVAGFVHALGKGYETETGLHAESMLRTQRTGRN